ncbi:hypothetical protein M407DRAFT_165298 [Tulasnella calospora MUT 4182]|uniref:Uncharacterized protein n=1 Tax=Tulasnella calospora MUT 4182 TaxID=1051891 RepID=A0A0C3Q4N5_9AGAM|nr:hypothetical protein M407DRAFT_165298 [Tulasnella calospora MUT 4182]
MLFRPKIWHNHVLDLNGSPRLQRGSQLVIRAASHTRRSGYISPAALLSLDRSARRSAYRSHQCHDLAHTEQQPNPLG